MGQPSSFLWEVKNSVEFAVIGVASCRVSTVVPLASAEVIEEGAGLLSQLLLFSTPTMARKPKKRRRKLYPRSWL